MSLTTSKLIFSRYIIMGVWLLVANIYMNAQTSSSDPASWTISPQSSKIGFTIKNAGIRVNGSFEGLEGEIYFSPDKLDQSFVKASVKTETINTNNNMRDKHLRSEDYFEVESFPEIRFTSNDIVKNKDGYIIKGDFAIKDVIKQVEIPFTFTDQVFHGEFEVNRLHYGVGKSSIILGNKVIIKFEISVNQIN